MNVSENGRENKASFKRLTIEMSFPNFLLRSQKEAKN